MSDVVEKILRGEKVNGWKSYRVDTISNTPSPYYRLLLPPWPKDGSEAVDTSVLVYAEERAPDGRSEYIYTIRRYSLIAPGLHDVIVQISYDYPNGWWPNVECYINENVVAIGWHRRLGGDEVRIMLVNINSKSYQLLEAATPHRNVFYICSIFIDSTSGHLMVLFAVRINNNNIAYHLSEYKITPSESNRSPIVDQVSSRQLAWPKGRWGFEPSRVVRYFPGAFYFMRNRVTRDFRVVSIDRDGIHNLFDVSNWLVEFERSAVGISMLKAKGGLGNLGRMYELHRSHLFARVSSTSYVHRPLFQPSMWYRSAEAMCAIPNVDFAKVKKEVGFDIFDGILDGKKPGEIHMGSE